MPCVPRLPSPHQMLRNANVMSRAKCVLGNDGDGDENDDDGDDDDDAKLPFFKCAFYFVCHIYLNDVSKQQQINNNQGSHRPQVP